MDKNKKILLADDIELFLEMERNFLQREDLDLPWERTDKADALRDAAK